MSDRALRTTGLVLTVLGIGVAGYLVYVHYAGIEPVCNIAHGCHKVQTSKYAELAGVPVALLGLIGYVTIFLTLLVRSEAARMLAALVALVGFGFSAYLTYRELFTIDAICQWCVASAILMTGLAVVCTWRVLTGVPAPRSLA
ncbi:MAG TPA: vitamin K epoxide reductase family protein [Baekduia sp.]|uniref:vitamin K epoxide reductase family protein n=1 Tax=Baekduia sp. TaxID=2600305 RepID=UPI002C40E917|nr:vitamin K epoxide reductase family protein [Baekduia sp.]HMJ35555.1 vitamin K epoxide reductase family protein [Baekduia sp.]